MRRFFLATMMIFGLLALSSPSLNQNAFASAAKNQTNTTISVPGNKAFIDTGINLTKGSSVSITASGIIYIAASDPGKTPAGDPSCTADSSYVGPGLPCWSLIAWIGNSVGPFEIGTSTSFSATASGNLFLGVNDNVFSDNSGSWMASVTVSNPENSVSLLAPFNKGDTFHVKTLGGYHNHPQTGCLIGTFPDHCNNQLFGLDLVPDNQSDTTVLAPVSGKIVGIPSDPQEFGCMQLELSDGLTLNICHFSTWSVTDGQPVVQGQALGTRSTIHVHLSLDNRQAGKPYTPVPFNGAHTIEGISLNPNHDGKGEAVTYAGQTFTVDVDEWQTWTGTSSN